MLDDATPVVVGMTVDFDGRVNIFGDQIQLQPSALTAAATPGAAIAPVAATSAEITTGGARADALEAVLVTISNAVVSNDAPPPTRTEPVEGQFEVDSTLRVDDFYFLVEPFVVMGENFTSITGVLMYRDDASKLHPRSADDYVAGAPQLASFGPAMNFARAGSVAGPTFPEALTVALTRPAIDPTTVTFTNTAGVTIGDVTIAIGASEAVVVVDASLASAGSGTVTADLDGDTLDASLRVLGAAEAPTTFTITPTSVMVPSSGMQEFTATLDIPAPLTGATITLSETTGGTIPVSLIFTGDEQTLTFDYTAPSSAITGSLTGSLVGTAVMQMVAIEVLPPQPGTLVVNEVDYNQTDTDAAEYIELYNPGTTAIQLAGIQLHLINQTGSPYGPTPLDLASGTATEVPAGGYLLIAVPAVTSLGAPTVALSPATNALQNGPNDGFFIYDSTNMGVLDAFGYDGSTTFTIGGTVVTMASTLRDATSGDVSLSRVPDGAMGATDDVFVSTMCPTPGAANFDSAGGACP